MVLLVLNRFVYRVITEQGERMLARDGVGGAGEYEPPAKQRRASSPPGEYQSGVTYLQ